MFTFIFFGTLSNTASAIQRRFIQEDCVYLTAIETVYSIWTKAAGPAHLTPTGYARPCDEAPDAQVCFHVNDRGGLGLCSY